MKHPFGTVCCAFVLASSCAAASLESAVTINLLSLYNRFGVDYQGNVLIAANPESCTLPTVNPLYTCGPIWIGKLDVSGRKLLFATYLGNGAAAGYTAVAGITADPDGNLIVAAHTVAPDLPVVNAWQSSPKSQFTSVYVAKLSADGARLLYATYLGGSGGQSALSLTVDNAGAAYVAATTTSSDFPTTAQSVHDTAPIPTLVAKLAPDGKLAYAATFPFEFYTDVKPVQVDAAGYAVLVSNLQILKVAPDGSSLTRTPLPEWATATTACTSAGVDIVCPVRPWAISRPTGGYQFVGTSAGAIPLTAGAPQNFEPSTGYVRIDQGRATHPPLPAPPSAFAVDPQNRNRIYAATSAGLFRSEDNAATWSLLHGGPCLAIALDPFDSNRLYLGMDVSPAPGGGARIYRSTDAGTSWTTILAGGPGASPITSIAADPNVRGLLYAAGRLLYRSTDGGDGWDARPVGPSRQDISPSASTSTSSLVVQVDPSHAGWAYVLGITRCIGFCPVTQNLSRTQDAGQTWTNASPVPDPPVSGTATPLLAVDPNTGDVVETSSEVLPFTQRLLAFRNGDFSAPQTLYPDETTAIAFDAGRPGIVYLGIHIAQGSGSGYYVIRSVDSGATWTRVVQLDRPVYDLTLGAGGVLHGSQNPNVPGAFLLVTDASAAVRYGTYFGGAFTAVNAVAALGAKLYVAGKTLGGLSLMDSIQPELAGGSDGFLAAFDENGAPLWCTYLGGAADDSIDWVLPVSDGSVVVVGTTDSDGFPSLQPSPLGAGKTFIAHLRP